jgi:hypothetical protein
LSPVKDDDAKNGDTTAAAEAFVEGKHCVEFYEETELEAAEQLILGVATNELKNMLRRISFN